MKIVLIEPLGINDEILNQLSESLIQSGHEFVAYHKRTEDMLNLVLRVEDADVIIIANQPLPGDVIRQCPHLKMISVAFTGVDHIDMDACRENGIIVCNAAGYSTHSVAELTLGLMISVLRKITENERKTRELRGREDHLGTELHGKTIGIIGTGSIGLRVAEILKVFGCKLLAYSRTEREEAVRMGIEYVPLEELLKQSDIVTLHVPANKESINLLSEDRLKLMKNSAVLINTARGTVIDNAALAHLLKQGEIAGAGIDIYETEPPLPADHPLLSAPNSVLMPHIAYATREALEKRAEIVFENIRKWQNGTPQNVM